MAAAERVVDEMRVRDPSAGPAAAPWHRCPSSAADRDAGEMLHDF